MSQINPIFGSIVQVPQAQRMQSTEKVRQLRFAQQLRNNISARDDELEHQVENTEALQPVDLHEQPRRQAKHDRTKNKSDDQTDLDDELDQPRLDLTA